MGEQPNKREGDSRGTWMSRHLWQIQPVRDLMMIAAVLLIIYVGYLTRLVTVPMLLAMALAYMFEPLVGRVTRGGRISRPGAAGIIILLALVLGIVPALVGLTFGTIQAAQGVQSLATNAEWLVRSVERPEDKPLADAAPGEAWRDIREWVITQQTRAKESEKAREEYLAKVEANSRAIAEGKPVDDEHTLVEPPPPGPVYQATAWGVKWLSENREQIGKRAIQAGAEWVNAAVRGLTTIGFLGFSAFLVAFFFYFFSAGYGKVLAFWEGLIPERRKGRVVDLLGQMDRVIAGFIRGRLTICACLMVFFTFAYGVTGVPGFLILGPIVGALSLLPYVAGLGAPVAMLLMWLDPGGGWQNEWWWIVGAPIGVSLLSQILDDYVLSPMIQGKNTDMDMPSILFASIAGGALAGVYGLLLAIPAAACIKILIKEVIWHRVGEWVNGRASDFIPIEKD